MNGRMAYEDDMGGVAQDQGDLADSVYQGADASSSPSMEPGQGGCDCAGQGGGDMAALLQNPELIALLAELLQGGGMGAESPDAGMGGGMDMAALMGGAGAEEPMGAPAAPPMGGPMDEEDEDPSAAALGGF